MWGNYVKGRLEVMRGGQVLASREKDCDMRWSGGGWDGWDGRHDKLQSWQHALKKWRHALQWWGMGWLGWALWQAGGRCGRDILHEFIYRWIARRWNAGRNMVVDNMRKQREGSTDGKTMELSSLLYYGNVRWTLGKCKENITQMYGYYYGNVWRITHKCMDIIMQM